MRKLLSIVVALIFSVLINASHAGMRADPVDIKLTFDEFLLPNAHILINDKPMVLSVDTGSSFAFHLTLDQIEALGAKKTTNTHRTIDAAGNLQENTLYSAENISLNGIALRSATIVPLQQWGLMMSGVGEPPIAPVIGLGAFANKVLVLDYKNKLMSIANAMSDALLAGERFTDYPFILAPEGLIFNVEHAGSAYKLVLDSGASVSGVWEERLNAPLREDCAIVDPELEIEGCKAVRLSAISSNGTRDAFTAITLPGRFDHMEHVDGLLGNNFLKTRKVIVDFANERLWVSEPSA